MDQLLKQNVDTYAANAFNSARQKICEESDQKMAALPQMGKGNAAYSKYADDRYVRLYAQRLIDLVQAKSTVLMDAYELYGVPFDAQILAGVKEFLDQTLAGMAGGAQGELGLEVMRIHRDQQQASMIGESFKRELTIQTHHMIGEVSCQIEKRKMMPKKPAEAGITNIYHLHGHNSRVNVQSTDQSVNLSLTGDQLFSRLRELTAAQIPEERRAEVFESLVALEKARDSATFGQHYTHFISVVADHITLFAPFIPALTEMLHRTLG